MDPLKHKETFRRLLKEEAERKRVMRERFKSRFRRGTDATGGPSAPGSKAVEVGTHPDGSSDVQGNDSVAT